MPLPKEVVDWCARRHTVLESAFVFAPPQPSAANLPPQWRSRLTVVLEELAIAWRAPAAWEGTARAGGVTEAGDMRDVILVRDGERIQILTTRDREDPDALTVRDAFGETHRYPV